MSKNGLVMLRSYACTGCASQQLKKWQVAKPATFNYLKTIRSYLITCIF